jgi:hypothetical protein
VIRSTQVKPKRVNLTVLEKLSDEFSHHLSELTAEEHEALKCRTGISSDWGGRRRSLP